MNEEIELTEADFIDVIDIPACSLPDEFAFHLIKKPTELEKRMSHMIAFREKLREATGL